MLVMNTVDYKTIKVFQIGFLQFDLFNFINNKENLCDLYIILEICAKTKQNMKIILKILLITRKVGGEILKNMLKFPPKLNQDKSETRLIVDIFICSLDIYKENIIIINSCKLLYLNF